MKNLLHVVALHLALGVPLSARAAVAVDDNMNVLIDGSNRGRLEDFIKNNPAQTGDVMLAVRAYHKAAAEAAAGEVANTKAAAAKDIAAKEAERTAALRAKTAAEMAAAQASERVETFVESVRVADRKLDEKDVDRTLSDILPAEAKAALRSSRENERAALLSKKAEIEERMAKIKP